MKSDNLKVTLLTIGVVGGFIGFLNGMNHSMQQPLSLTLVFGFISIISTIYSLVLFVIKKKK